MFAIFQAARLPVWALAGLHLASASTAALAQASADPVAAPTAISAAASTPASPYPADPRASVPAALYRSPFTGYQVYSEGPVAPWRDTNELVRQRGGWRAYAREASAPAATKPSVDGAASAPPAAPAGHSGHSMK